MSTNQSSNGFELIRQLTLEFSVRSRSEALTFRTALAAKTFQLSSAETSPSSVVTDTIRRLDFEAARYQKLVSTLPSTVDVVGLQLAEPDLVSILLRSLPESVKGYVIHHSEGDSYQAYRVAAQKWERQQRMIADMNASKKSMAQVESQVFSPTEYFDMTYGDDGQVFAMDQERCEKCGSRKHSTGQCTVDISKTKCSNAASMATFPRIVLSEESDLMLEAKEIGRAPKELSKEIG